MRNLLAALCLAVTHLALAHAAAVEQFTPQGTATGVRQAAARFSSDMVGLGDPALPDPFAVDCPVPGSGHWIDTRNWVYDFTAPVPAGLACRFTLRAGVQDLEGHAPAAARFAFDTGGPAVAASMPAPGDAGIREDQVFLLVLSGAADARSLEGRVHCVEDGVGERIALRAVTPQERQRVLAASRHFLHAHDGASTAPGTDEAAVFVGRCERRLAAGHRVSVVWGAGVASPAGVATVQDQTLAYTVRPAFRAAMRCQRINAQAGCLGVRPVELTFNAAVTPAQARRAYLEGAGRRWHPVLAREAEAAGEVHELRFDPPFPQRARLRLVLPAGLRDVDGRVLANAERFPLEVAIDEAPPLARFAADFGIYERDAEPALPLTVRHVGTLSASTVALPAQELVTRDPKQVLEWLRRLRRAAVDDSAPYDQALGYAPVRHFGAESSVFAAADGARALPLLRTLPDDETEVIGIPLAGSGLHVVEVASPRLGQALMARERPYHVRSAALVTAMAVHFKAGRESSLAWVTRLADGEAVADAEVAVRDCAGQVLAHGRTNAQGLWHLHRPLPGRNALPACLDRWDHQMLVTAATADDFTFLLSDWGEGIAPWRFNLPEGGGNSALALSAVLDRGLYRSGETIGMKLVARVRNEHGFGRPDPAQLGQTVLLRHQGSETQVRLPVHWDRWGTAELEYVLPPDTHQGSWDILLERRGGRQAMPAGSFRVAAFRVPTLRATLSGPAQAVAASAVALDMQAAYLAGGPAALLPVRVLAQVQDLELQFPGHDEASVANGRAARAAGATPDAEQEDSEDNAGPAGAGIPLATRELRLDAGGSGRITLTDLPPVTRPRLLLAEAEYRDAAGELRNAAARIRLLPAGVLAGVEADGWAQPETGQRLRLLALDPAGQPQAGVPVTGRLYAREYFSHRRRVIGGFYAYTHTRRMRALGEVCSGVTDAQGSVACTFRTEARGSLVLEAEARDAAGHSSFANREFWVGDGEGWTDASDHDRMDLVPERRHWEPGERARLRLRMPFEEATVLVTVEREGVLDAWVRRVRRADPVIEVPVRPGYGPNVFVSALALRGRVSAPAPTALLDLGRPAFRLGMAELQVGWSGYALDVRLSTDRRSYQPRDRARLHVAVRRPDGSIPDAAEIAVAAVDEALLELAPNRSWNLLEAMLQRRGIEVRTSTGQQQVVGRRHYGRKALPPGGGGGRGPARELFDTRLLWKARVALDAKGETDLEVPLGDSLSQFRLVAVATAGAERFGTGDTRIEVTQDLQLFGSLPPAVREGDRFDAHFTVRNASTRAMWVDLAPQLGGRTLAPSERHLEPGEAAELTVPVTAQPGEARLQWDVSARERDGTGRDRLRQGQAVEPLLPVRTLQATVARVDALLTLPVALPPGAVAGRGGIDVQMRARLGSELDGVREYLQDYPWSCLEQQVSRAVGLHDAARWKELSARLPAYLDADGLARYWPQLPAGSDTLSAYLMAVSHEAGLALPEAVQGRLIESLRAFVEGRITRPSEAGRPDLTLRKLAALEALSRYPAGRLQPAWLESLELAPERWPTSALLDWLQLLQRSPQLPQRDARLAQARQLVQARLVLSGTRLSFATEAGDRWWWLMVDGDVNANRLLLAALDGGERTGADLARLLQGSLGRQRQGHWSTTVANAWGVLALQRFAQRLEANPVSGRTRAQLGTQALEHAWDAAATGGGTLPWPARPDTLQVTHEGAGAPWVTVGVHAAVALTAPQFAGVQVVREVLPVRQQEPGHWHRGDVQRIRLSVQASSDLGWVAVQDPVPAGATILGTGLGGDSAILVAGERAPGNAWPAYEERGRDAFRAYYRRVPAGTFTLEYTLRLNQEGRFGLPPTRVEAMYAPDIHADLPLQPLEVLP